METAFLSQLSDTARDMLTNANLHVGSQVGVGSQDGMDELRAAKLVGANNGLTRTGLAAAQKLQDAYFGGGDDRDR